MDFISLHNLLSNLRKKDDLHDRRLIRAFNSVPLEKFIGKSVSNESLYKDKPKFFYESEITYRNISAPHMICIMLESLVLETNDDLLILGSKSGYIAALASCLSLNGEIFIIEANEDVARKTIDNLKRSNFYNRISVIHKNPLQGMPEGSPWQKILVTGQIEKKYLKNILNQLDPNEGMLFAPIGTEKSQKFTQIVREDKDFYENYIGNVIFGPLETEVTFIDDSNQKLVEEEDLIINEEEFESAAGIEFKKNPYIIEKKFEKIKKDYSIVEQMPQLTNAQIIQIAEKCVIENKGSSNLLEISNKANIELEDLINTLQKENFGYIKKPNPNNYIDAILYLKPPEEEKLKKINLISEEILNIINSIEEEIDYSVIKESINQIKFEVEKLINLLEIPKKKIEKFIRDLRGLIIIISRVDRDHLVKNNSYYNIVSNLEKRKVDICDELSETIKKVIAK